MHQRLAASWWSLVIRGIVAIVFGFLAFAYPGLALTTLILFFGAFAVVDGVFAIASGIRPHGAHGRDWLLVIGGGAGILLGFFAFLSPGLTAVALVYVIGAWAIVTGAFEILAAIRMRAVMQHVWLLVVAGVLSVVFGILLWVAPGAGALTLLWLIAAYSIAFGAMHIVLGLRLRRIAPAATAAAPSS